MDTLEPVHRSLSHWLPSGLISAHRDSPRWQSKDSNLGKMQVPSGQKHLPCLLTPLRSSLPFLAWEFLIDLSSLHWVWENVSYTLTSFSFSSCFLPEGSSQHASPPLLGKRSPALVFRRFTQSAAWGTACEDTSVEAGREISYCNNQDETCWWLGIRWQRYRNPRQKGWIL